MEAVAAAKQQGLRAAETLDRALRRAFFARSANISMRHEVLAVAAACDGVDPDALKAALVSGLARAAIEYQLAVLLSDAVQGSPHLFLPDGTSVHNPGITLRWVGQHGSGFPVVDADDPTVYPDLLRRGRPREDVEPMSVNIAVIYYSATGNVHRLAEAVAQGATGAGAQVRLRTVAELAPAAAIAGNPRWAAHAHATREVPEANLQDLEWADGWVFGSPTRFGNVASQLRQFLDTTGGLWAQGKLADKAVSGFTSSGTLHGGQESTLLSMYQVFMHWGAIIVPTGYTDPSIDAAGGNPYGVSSLDAETGPDDAALAAARYQGARVTAMAGALARRHELALPA